MNAHSMQVFVNGKDALPRELTGYVSALEWGDLSGELAARAVITLDDRAGDMDIAELVRLNADISVLVDGECAFEGLIWDCTLTDGRQMRLVCYDRLIFLTGSRDSAYFPAGMSTARVLDSICRRWDMPLICTYPGCTHGRLNYRSMTVAEQITRTLDAARAVCGRDYMLRMEDGALRVGERGAGGTAARISADMLIGSTHRRDMNGMVTRVKVISADGDSPVRTYATLDGDTSVGILQEVVEGAGASLKDAREQARLLLAERGAPTETISMQCIDIPKLRRGDAIEVNAGGISGTYDVLGVSHDRALTMKLELSRHVELQ